jgi:hypothetical protein
LNRDANSAVPFKQHIDDTDTLLSVHSMLAGVVEHHLVELAADDLPGLRALVRFVVPEVQRGRRLSASVDELNTVLLREVTPLHLVQHVESLESQ